MHEEALQDTTGVSNAAIQVARIRGAILLISGERDRLWPATKMSKMITDHLQACKFGDYHEHIAVDTGHNGIIMNKDCWRKTFYFLEDHFA